MSRFIEWSDALSVGIDEIDAQHRVLLNLVNEMHDAIEHRHGSDVVGDVLRRLEEYTRVHFAVEESLMRMHGYPQLEAHKVQHARLVTHLNELRDRFDHGRGPLGFELMHFLKLWLTEHIMESDQDYAQFFINREALPSVRRGSLWARLWGRRRG